MFGKILSVPCLQVLSKRQVGDYIDCLVREKKATVRFHVLSFLGDESVRAANASFCAADEGRYLRFPQGSVCGFSLLWKTLVSGAMRR
jgi:hypothetical protein